MELFQGVCRELQVPLKGRAWPCPCVGLIWCTPESARMGTCRFAVIDGLQNDHWDAGVAALASDAGSMRQQELVTPEAPKSQDQEAKWKLRCSHNPQGSHGTLGRKPWWGQTHVTIHHCLSLNAAQGAWPTSDWSDLSWIIQPSFLPLRPKNTAGFWGQARCTYRGWSSRIQHPDLALKKAPLWLLS